MNPINKAYQMLFGQSPGDYLEPWEVVKAVIDGFNGSKLDEITARDVLESIIADVVFPDHLTKQVVGKAENLLPEVCADYSPLEEIHMATVERVRWLREHK